MTLYRSSPFVDSSARVLVPSCESANTGTMLKVNVRTQMASVIVITESSPYLKCYDSVIVPSAEMAESIVFIGVSRTRLVTAR